jgi:hypothetical protein
MGHPLRRCWNRSFLTCLCALALVPPSWAASPVVGDANGDGTFSGADLMVAIGALRHGWTRPNPLADVARPCDGVLRAADGQRLLAAFLMAQTGIPVRSRCHAPAIGEPVPPPPTPPRLVTLDEQFLALAGRVPGFAGFFVEQGRIRVALTDPSPALLRAALVEIERTFGPDRFSTQGARAVRATYDFVELNAWKEAALALLGGGRVTLVDADERRNRVIVGLRTFADRQAVAEALRRAGVPAAAIVFEVRRPFAPLLDPLTAALQEKQRPLVGGVVIETTGGACTLGFLAKWYGGPRGFITNSHCLPPIGNAYGPGLQVFQDGFDFVLPVDPVDPIGFEAVDPALGCGGACRASDAAFVGLDDDETGRLGRIAGTPGAPPPASWFGHYDVVGKGLAVCGESVRFVGARSGEVAGEVNCTCCGAEGGSGVVWSCQTGFTAPTGDSGDSGSAVFRPLGVGFDAELLGVLWGGADGQLAYSPISNIESEIGALDVAVQDDPPKIEIVAPPDGGNLGGGAFPVAGLVAEVFDFEEGGECGACTVDWYSGKDGVLGSTPWIAGGSSLDAVLGGGPGYRAITATAHNAAAQTAWDTIVLSSGNSAPAVWLDWPPSGATLYRDVPYQLQASSFDSESFQALPCAELEWTLAGPSSAAFPAHGCFPVVTFEATGFHFLEVAGSDEGHLEGSSGIPLSVVDPPPGSPPIVTFWSPGEHQAFAFDSTVTVLATAVQPGGSAPLQAEWSLESPELLSPGPLLLGTATIPNGGSTSIAFQPSDFLQSGCGEAPMEVWLTVTAPGPLIGSGSLSLGAMRPPC